MTVENYDILNILGNTINSTTYKVKNKDTKEIFIWQTIDCETLATADFEVLIAKLKKRQELNHPNLLKFYDYIEESKVIYIVTEYCENGSLRSITNSCLNNETYLSEELVCKILYQIAFTIKTTDSYIGKLTTKEIFLDADYNIKLYNFKLDKKDAKEPKMSYLGLALYEACTLKPFDRCNYENEMKKISKAFSSSLLSLIICMIKDNSELKKNINKVLCHPTVLLKSSQWVKEKCFLKIDTIPKIATKQNDQADNASYNYKLEKLRKKEITLQFREQQLNEKEHKLATREKKIILMERSVKEKLQQAELYLKRCRETKSIRTASTKSNDLPDSEKTSYDNLDSTYISCGDSILLPTSTKLNVSKIIKPAPFTRTMSERRIRFKGHSPLKEMDMNKRRSMKPPKLKSEYMSKRSSEWLTCSEDTDKSSKEGSTNSIYNKSRQLFPQQSFYENDSTDVQCKPLTWTKEGKKYAFELLKVINGDKENQCLEVKHTYL